MRSPYAMRATIMTFHLLFGFIVAFEKGDPCKLNQKNNVIIGKIVGVFDESSRVGKEMKIASEMAVNDFYVLKACDYKVVLFTTNSSTGSSDQIASSVPDLIETEQVVAIIGAVHMSSSAKLTRTIPIISILPTAMSSPSHPQFLHFTTQLSATTQCIAAIVSHFRWWQVTAIYESSPHNDLSPLVAQLANSLDQVNSAIESTQAIGRVDLVERELRKLRGQRNRVFVVLRGSLEFSKALFGKAKELGMMEKGFVWILSEDISNMIDSVEAEFLVDNMEGVIGLKIDYLDTSHDYKRFKHRFRKR